MKIGRIFHNNHYRSVEILNDGNFRHLEGELFGTLAKRETIPSKTLFTPLVPRDIFCIGLNYREHAREGGSAIPVNPVVFMKASNSLNHPNHSIPLSNHTQRMDFEAELAVIIGKSGKEIPLKNAMDHVFGYTCANDISARDWQKDRNLGGGQFILGKSFDGFCPLGPWIVTKDEIPDPQSLKIQCHLNGKIMQDANTSDMIFPVSELIHKLSRTMTLQKGAIILTGTPAGVGFARTPPLYLKFGDKVSVTIENIGTLENFIGQG